jgi:hypothetical protein
LRLVSVNSTAAILGRFWNGVLPLSPAQPINPEYPLTRRIEALLHRFDQETARSPANSGLRVASLLSLPAMSEPCEVHARGWR